MPDLDSLSILFIWTAIAIYAAAFIAYAFDLARRSEITSDARLEREKELVGAGAPPMWSAYENGAEPPASEGGAKPRYVMARIGMTLTVLGFLFHLAATVLRGIAAERVPWANLYEFAMTGTVLIMFVYLLVNTRMDLRFLGTFVTGLVIVLMGAAAVSFYVDVVPLMDPLKSVWLIIHVFVASLSTAFFALGGALSVLQLMQSRRERRLAEGSDKTGPRFLGTLSAADRLEARRFVLRSSASSSGPSRSSPDRSGRRMPGVATGASTSKRPGRSSSGCSTPGTFMPARLAAGAETPRPGCQLSASPQ